jgi:hypothetical protein
MVQSYGKKIHECNDNTHAVPTYVAPSTNSTEEREHTISLPNPRCMSFSSVSLVLFILLKQTPPSHPPTPYPIPRCVLTDTAQPPTLVEAWGAYTLLQNSTGAWVHGAPQVRTRRQRHSPPRTWSRGLCAYCCRTTLVQRCL